MTYLRLVLLVAVIVLAGVMMAIVCLLPRRAWLRWWIEIPLILGLRRALWRGLRLGLALAVVGVVGRWWTVVGLRVRGEILASGVIVVCCHVEECVVVVLEVVVL